MSGNFWLKRQAVAIIIRCGISVKDWQRGVAVWRLGPLSKDCGKFCVNIDDGDNKYREWICDTAKEAAVQFLQVQ
jgi:hypothetical protein